MHSPRRHATGEWKANWPLVAASTAGFSFATIAPATFGLFMEPLASEFGWSRAEISSGLTVFALVAVPLSPFAGAMIDRWGSRRLALPGLILTAISFAAFSLMNGSLALWFATWLVYASVALGIKGTVWTAAVTRVFSTERGLALALTLSGSALAMAFAPIIAQRLVDHLGWRSAYVSLAAGWGTFALVLVALFFFDGRDRTGQGINRMSAVANAPLTGLTISEAARNPALIRIGSATLITVTVVSAVSLHQIPLLTSKGLTRETAAILAGSAGIASIAGKIVTGWLLDRSRSAWIGAVGLALPALSFLLLLPPQIGRIEALAAIVLIGYSNGAFVQISAYMTSRYGGQRNFGKIYGTMASLTALGMGIGPVLAGLAYDRLHTYAPLLACGVPLALLSGALVIGLGPYPEWPEPAGD